MVWEPGGPLPFFFQCKINCARWKLTQPGSERGEDSLLLMSTGTFSRRLDTWGIGIGPHTSQGGGPLPIGLKPPFHLPAPYPPPNSNWSNPCPAFSTLIPLFPGRSNSPAMSCQSPLPPASPVPNPPPPAGRSPALLLCTRPHQPPASAGVSSQTHAVSESQGKWQ